MNVIIIIITWLPFILAILTIKPNAFFSQHIHEVDSFCQYPFHSSEN